ncbi:MAG TPA: 4Fe-4S ferredoxin [Ignavibacteriaceae bacterium]|nr:4Fe-4S ferredoxin [Ignavibacteriaceae bacterium]
MKRKIINIDEQLCDGCGLCIPECHEGALQLIDGKARLISDLFCDGLGACLGYCPQGAITVEEREAEPYDEEIVMDTIVKGGQNVIQAHLKHLKEHNEFGYLAIALNYLKERSIPYKAEQVEQRTFSSCPGSAERTIKREVEPEIDYKPQSQLTQWPIQLHLVSPFAEYYQNSNLLLAADCCAFSFGDFHNTYMKDRSIAIACPKLDTNKEVYLNKLIAMINDSNIQSITVVIMQVPCCRGLLSLAQQAVDMADKDVPVKVSVIGINGEILN